MIITGTEYAICRLSKPGVFTGKTFSINDETYPTRDQALSAIIELGKCSRVGSISEYIILEVVSAKNLGGDECLLSEMTNND